MKRLMCAAAVAALSDAAGGAGQSRRVMTEVREALGGDKLAQVKALSLEGPFGREMGQRQVQGTIALTLAAARPHAPQRRHRD